MRPFWFTMLEIVAALAVGCTSGGVLALFTRGGIRDNLPIALAARAFWAGFLLAFMTAAGEFDDHDFEPEARRQARSIRSSLGGVKWSFPFIPRKRRAAATASARS